MEITEFVHVGEHLIRLAQIVALPSEGVSSMHPTGTIQAETAVQHHKDAAGRFSSQFSFQYGSQGSSHPPWCQGHERLASASMGRPLQGTPRRQDRMCSQFVCMLKKVHTLTYVCLDNKARRKLFLARSVLRDVGWMPATGDKGGKRPKAQSSLEEGGHIFLLH